MSNSIKFNRHHVAANGIKARVHYSLDNRTDGRACVTMYAKDYSRDLGNIFADYVNETDYQTDYFDKGRAVLFADHPQYVAARAAALAAHAAFDARIAKRYAAR
jgi:hypothetical protein